jgi:hypothetical protein
LAQVLGGTQQEARFTLKLDNAGTLTHIFRIFSFEAHFNEARHPMTANSIPRKCEHWMCECKAEEMAQLRRTVAHWQARCEQEQAHQRQWERLLQSDSWGNLKRTQKEWYAEAESLALHAEQIKEMFNDMFLKWKEMMGIEEAV